LLFKYQWIKELEKSTLKYLDYKSNFLCG